MLHHAIISASEFNAIPLFDSQSHEVPVEALLAVGKLLLESGLEEDYCITLLHRHFDLQAEHIMVHSSGNGEDVCTPRRVRDLDMATLVPCSIFLNRDLSFQPFEYAFGTERVPLTQQFLHQLRSLLVAKQLETILALATSPSPRIEDGLAVETLLPDLLGMHTVLQAGQDHDISSSESVVTGWTFDKDGFGNIRIRAVKECVKNAVGVHEVRDAQTAKTS